MTDLESFSYYIIDNGGEWYLIKDHKNYTWWGSIDINNVILYQIFDEKEHRIFLTNDYNRAFSKFKNLIGEN